MHMADALISPEAGGLMWAAAVALIAYSARKVKQENNDKKVPLMGILGAFIFAAQMINFTIPGTGSSGHLGGGMILAVLLGRHAAFLVMASVLTVQALFFADGGLLALGCNIFNLGFFPCFLAYPYIYTKITGNNVTVGRIYTGSIASVLPALLAGAFFVVIETVMSGISELPFSSFLIAMMPIHAAIAIIEGIITGVIINFIWKSEPDILTVNRNASPAYSLKKIIITLLIFTVLIGGGLSWFASSNPDGLEWSIAKITGKEELNDPADRTHSFLADIQKKLSFLPDYNFKKPEAKGDEENKSQDEKEKWPAVETGTTVSGLIGGALTILIITVIGILLKLKRRKGVS